MHLEYHQTVPAPRRIWLLPHRTGPSSPGVLYLMRRLLLYLLQCCQLVPELPICLEGRD